MKTSILLIIFMLQTLYNAEALAQEKISSPPVFPAKPGLTVVKKEQSGSKLYYASGIPDYIVKDMKQNRIKIEKQEAQYWCWAACVQSLIYQSGNNISQSDIAAALSGFPWDRPATLDELTGLLQQYGFSAMRTGKPASQWQMVQIFDAREKIIAYVEQDNNGIGHSVLLQGIDKDLNVYISDPATGLTSRRHVKDVYEGWKWLDAIVVSQKMNSE